MLKQLSTLILCVINLIVFAQSPAPTGLLCQLLSHPELSVITERKPQFGWIVNSDKQGDMQKSYHIMVASSRELLNADRPDMWNSGKVKSAQSINVIYAGKPLTSNVSYFWKVKTYNKKSEASSWSEIQQFNTGEFDRAKKWPGESKWVQINLANGSKQWTFENRHPLTSYPVRPVRKAVRANGVHFFDFGRSAFASLEMKLTWKPSNSTDTVFQLKINIGEKGVGDTIDQKPGGGVIFRTYSLKIKPGTKTYMLEIPRFVPKYPHSQPMPLQIPEVAPFRFCELICGAENIVVQDITHKTLYMLYNDKAANFKCSNSDVNAIYGLCKYSTIANTFNGDYANSERERMMYEADCYIQQMGHYAIDREFAIARYSTENLIYHATWPTEWISHSIFMAYADYLYTGNTDLISKYYDDLKAKTMIALQTEKGLISTRTGLQTKEFLKSIHFNGGGLKDIVDWPHGSMSTLPGGETDNYEFKDYNTVVNAFYYQSLLYMAKMSAAIGKNKDAVFFNLKADSVKVAFNKHFFDNETGFYVDGIDSKHSSLHANMYPLCFGLVPADNKRAVIDFIKSKRMACGVYSSHYLLEALFNNDEANYAMSLITDNSDRSWLNMIRVGATMTTEAWDNKYKSNNGWSHAWSASPVHILPRKLLGIEPAAAGFGKINIRPQPAGILQAKAKLPTIRGDIEADYTLVKGKSFELNVTTPVNTTATVYLPIVAEPYKLKMDGKYLKANTNNGYVVLKNVRSGKHSFMLESLH